MGVFRISGLTLASGFPFWHLLDMLMTDWNVSCLPWEEAPDLAPPSYLSVTPQHRDDRREKCFVSAQESCQLHCESWLDDVLLDSNLGDSAGLVTGKAKC